MGGICKYCNKPYNNWMSHCKVCDKYKEYKNKNLSKLTYSFLYEQYIVQEKSMGEIKRELHLRTSHIKAALHKYGIPLRTHSQTRYAKGYIRLTKETCLKKFGTDYAHRKGSTVYDKQMLSVRNKYGVDNVWSVPYIKEKIKQTNLEKYGVDNPSKSKSIRYKVMTTCLNRYGYSNPASVPEFIHKQKLTRKKRSKNCHTSNVANTFFTELLKRLSTHEHVYCANLGKEYCVMSEDKELYFYDFVHTEKCKCIEFNGDYWHCNPHLYNSNWINPHTKRTALEIWTHDDNKLSTIKKLRNFECLIVWEYDVKHNFNLELQKCLEFLSD